MKLYNYKYQTMKKTIFSLGVVMLFLTFSTKAITLSKISTKQELTEVSKNIPTHFIPKPNMEQIKKEDALAGKKGTLYRMGIATYTNLNTTNSGVWTTLSTGEKKWQLIIQNPGAEALSFIFNTFKLSRNSSFWVQTKTGEKVSKIHTQEDLLEDFQQNVALCYGDELVLTLIDKPNEPQSELNLGRVFYNYRSTGNKGKEKINESSPCEVNVNCIEGNDYQEEKRGIALVYIVEGQTAGYCSGSLVNNLANDCKPLFLTALHCGVSTTASDMLLWKFYFRYEAISCTNPTSVGTLFSHYVNSCIRLSDSDDNGGDSGSDFLLLHLGTVANETATINTLRSTAINAYWNGWDANNTPSSGGVGIHHPSGDIKKISTYTVAPTSSSFGGQVQNTHWDLGWSGTTNGYGITEEGSSGSPLFTYNNGSSRIIGTLTGGATYCDALTAHDEYGKVSFHWKSNGSTPAKKLATYLDPLNSGILVLNGSANPCSGAGIIELETNNEIIIFPNPTSDKLNLDLTNLVNQKVTIEIIDMTGKTINISSHSTDSIINIELGELTKGVYQIKINSKDSIIIKRILKI